MIDLHRSFRAAACGLALVLSFATVARAQLQPALPGTPQFAQHIAGLDINVFTLDGQKHSGVFTINGESLVSADQTKVIAFDQIRRVEKNSYRMRLHSLIGLGVGAGIGFASMAGCEDFTGQAGQRGTSCGTAFVLTTAVAGTGAALGSAVGGILNHHYEPSDLIFERPGGSRRTIAFMPMLSPIKKGIAFTLRWR